jgi:Flp pilus assembly pilin Flp
MSDFIIRSHIKLQNISRAMVSAMNDAAERLRREDGQDLVEYGGLLILVAAIIGALFAAGIVSDFTTYVKPAVKTIFTTKAN